MAKTEFIDKNPPSEAGTIITSRHMDRFNNQVPTGEAADGASPLLHGTDIGTADNYVIDFVFGQIISSGDSDTPGATGYLTDAAATFSADGVEQGFEVVNISDRESTTVKSVIDDTNLELDSGVSIVSGKKYAVGRHIFQAPITLYEGLRISFKAANTNTGASTITVNGIQKDIKHRNGNDLDAGAISTNDVIELS